MTAPEAGGPPPVVRIVAPPPSSAALLIVTLLEALRARGYRTATAERRPAGGLSITLASGGRIGVERSVAAGELGAFVAGLDPRADLVLALGFDDAADGAADGALPTIELTDSAQGGVGGQGGKRLATVAEAELTASLQTAGRSSIVDDLAALLDARLLGGSAGEARGGAPTARRPPGRLRGGLLGRLRGLGRRR